MLGRSERVKGKHFDDDTDERIALPGSATSALNWPSDIAVLFQ